MAADPARLLLITHEFHPHRGGIAVYAAEMAGAATRLGYDVEVWAPDSTGTRDRAWPFRVRRLPMPPTHDLRSQWRMAREIHRHRESLKDAILYLPEPGPILAMLFLQYFGVPQGAHLALTLHGSEILRLHQRFGTRLAAGRLFARADRISVVSRHTRDLLLGHFPGAAGRVTLTPGALRTDFPATPAPSSPGRPNPGRLVVLTVARLHPRKGQLHVIEALRGLPPELRARVEYRIAGAHGKENYDLLLDEAARTADFPVRFLGDVPDAELPAVYAQADIFAMTSVPHKHSVEGFGLVYLEAGAYGLPVVAHAIGGVPEAVIDGETGLLVPPGDTAALTAVFAKLLAEPGLRARLGEGGRRHARGRTWDDSARTLFGQPRAAGPAS